MEIKSTKALLAIIIGFLSIIGLSCQEQQCDEVKLAAMNTNNSKPCHKYFTCRDNNAIVEVHCPHGLFWNKNKGYCDFPSNETCVVAESDLELLRPSREKILYLTFDDGPWIGTKEVLDALKEHDIKATFFLNMLRPFEPSLVRPGWTLSDGQRDLIRMVREGHALADHSYDHMEHNNNSTDNNRDPYKNPEIDAKYFVNKNFEKVDMLMRKAGIPQTKQKQISDTFYRFARLPYSDNWRINEFRVDCHICSTPPRSALYAILTADILKDKYATNAIGWDQEWKVVRWYVDQCHKFDALGLLMRLLTTPTKLTDKIVLLTHDRLYFESGDLNYECGRQNLKQLKLFLKWAKQLGYIFRTIDSYII